MSPDRRERWGGGGQPLSDTQTQTTCSCSASPREAHDTHTRQPDTVATEANIHLCYLDSVHGCENFFTTTCILVEILRFFSFVWLVVTCESSSQGWSKNSPECQIWLQRKDETTGRTSCSHTDRYGSMQLHEAIVTTHCTATVTWLCSLASVV